MVCTNCYSCSDFDDPQNLMKILFEPFSAALQIAIDTSAHPWQLMNDICVQYVEAFGDHALDFGDDNNSSRLKWASLYLLNAIKIKKQHSLLARNTVALSNELDFLTAPDEELMKIIVGCSSSSATKKKGGDLVEEVQADDPKAEKKDKAKVATTGPPKLDSPNGRDGLYLLVSLLRECDNIWTDTMEQNLCIDMNYLFKSKYSSFSKLCLLAVPPSTNEELTVPIGSVSTLWRATKAPDVMQQEEEEEDEADLSEEAKEKLKTLNTVGLYSYCAVFFLLGDKSKSVAESEVSAIKGKPGKGKDIAAPVVEKSKEPVLTKLVLPRFEVVKFEKRLRRLKDQYVDAEAKKQVELITVYNTQLAELLMSMRSLVKHGSSSASIAVSSENGYEGDQYSIAEKEGESGKVLLSIPSLDNPKHLTTVTISTDFIQHLADVFCVDVATECLVNNDICCLVRDALGFVG